MFFYSLRVKYNFWVSLQSYFRFCMIQNILKSVQIILFQLQHPVCKSRSYLLKSKVNNEICNQMLELTVKSTNAVCQMQNSCTIQNDRKYRSPYTLIHSLPLAYAHFESNFTHSKNSPSFRTYTQDTTNTNVLCIIGRF